MNIPANVVIATLVIAVFTGVWVVVLTTWVRGRQPATREADPIAEHIDTAAALLLPDADLPLTDGCAEQVDDWIRAGMPRVWPVPVVPGRNAA